MGSSALLWRALICQRGRGGTQSHTSFFPETSQSLQLSSSARSSWIPARNRELDPEALDSSGFRPSQRDVPQGPLFSHCVSPTFHASRKISSAPRTSSAPYDLRSPKSDIQPDLSSKLETNRPPICWKAPLCHGYWGTSSSCPKLHSWSSFSTVSPLMFPI